MISFDNKFPVFKHFTSENKFNQNGLSTSIGKAGVQSTEQKSVKLELSDEETLKEKLFKKKKNNKNEEEKTANHNSHKNNKENAEDLENQKKKILRLLNLI